MKNIISFSDAKNLKKKKTEELRPAFPTRAEAECFRESVDSYKKTIQGNSLPYWMFDGRELKSIWENTILPIAEDEGIDPWDIAGIFFASTHGMDFIYKDGKPVAAVYRQEE